jgi:hypothetical protein
MIEANGLAIQGGKIKTSHVTSSIRSDMDCSPPSWPGYPTNFAPFFGVQPGFGKRVLRFQALPHAKIPAPDDAKSRGKRATA